MFQLCTQLSDTWYALMGLQYSASQQGTALDFRIVLKAEAWYPAFSLAPKVGCQGCCKLSFLPSWHQNPSPVPTIQLGLQPAGAKVLRHGQHLQIGQREGLFPLDWQWGVLSNPGLVLISFCTLPIRCNKTFATESVLVSS